VKFGQTDRERGNLGSWGKPAPGGVWNSDVVQSQLATMHQIVDDDNLSGRRLSQVVSLYDVVVVWRSRTNK
jgi:hypothetical protein